MRWSDVVAAVRVVEQSGRGDVDVRGVQYDSRRVSAGDVFVAMRGGSTDGNKYIDAAIRRGASAVVTDSAEVFAEFREKQPELAMALVGDGPTAGRRALAEVSSAVFGAPEKKLKVSAVTGTNGKTTTAFLLEQMLRSVGRKCVLIGTIETHVGDVARASEHTTPESRDLLALFAEGVRAGCTEVVMEMSSHALEQERVWGIPVDVAMFTNLTQDHLDYHGTMEAYFEAKARLFQGVGAEAPRCAVLNDDDPKRVALERIFSQAQKGRPGENGHETFVYGMTETARYRAENIELGPGYTRFDLTGWEHYQRVRVPIHSPLTGSVNVSNLLAAICAAEARGLSLAEIVAAVPKLQQVPGRFEVVPGSRMAGFTVVVDYAHTDDALKNLMALARDLVRGSGGRVITMFGCGGDRDKTKRPKMGRAAAKGSDLVIVTSDNPRSEKPEAIIDEVLVGVKETRTECVVEVDRHRAIEVAIRAARPGDIVLLAGKGHEKVQIFTDGEVPFDDVAEAERVLRELKTGSVETGVSA
jgi:UDP-N-acetylmuramoyl-L-alanyl-D-glutamate--2,6-diaminopimelate ligase